MHEKLDERTGQHTRAKRCGLALLWSAAVLLLALATAVMRLSRVPWNFGGGPFDHQAAFWSSFWLAVVTFLKCASSAARSLGRCR